ncbi:hypothetical protein [Rhodoferax sp. GW822-FHT02A01]|uniref:hypothetical protein n=1 Tax=Rhodoferax sp. GW822-FHT02A01 TaxID=3141537 RepID=UPI00315C518E
MNELPISMQEANRFQLAFQDMRDARGYLMAILELESKHDSESLEHFFMATEGLFIAALVCYSRSFVDSKSDGHAIPLIGIKNSQMFANQKGLKSLHHKVLERRQKAAAHSDWEFHQTDLVDDGYPGALRRHPRPHYRRDIDIADFFALVDHVGQFCLHKGFELDEENRTTYPDLVGKVGVVRGNK